MSSFKRCFGVSLLLLITAATNAQQSSPVTLKELLNQVNQKYEKNTLGDQGDVLSFRNFWLRYWLYFWINSIFKKYY